jgi:hypothetical protein
MNPLYPRCGSNALAHMANNAAKKRIVNLFMLFGFVGWYLLCVFVVFCLSGKGSDNLRHNNALTQDVLHISPFPDA